MRRRPVRLVVGAGALALLGTFAATALASAASSSDDPYFPEQWALTRIAAPLAWSKSTGTGVRIGVIDTGVDLTHEDLAAKVVASTNCIGAKGIPEACTGSAQDDQGHGTHVAGIAAAVTGNNKGVAGVAPDAPLVIVKALGSNGSGSLSDVNAGIKWAVNKGARVINLSLESDGSQVVVAPGQSLADGVEYAYAHNAVVVVAAGNSTPSLFGGGGYASVDAVVVGATGRNDEVAWYSSSLTGSKWALVAPGGDARGSDGHASCAGTLAADCIVSTGWFSGHTNQYADDEGTSMATPHVAGALALIMAQNPTMTAGAAVQRLLSTADRIPCGDGCRGRLDAAAAVGASVPASPPPSGPSPTVGPAPTQPSHVLPGSAAPTAPAPDAPAPIPPGVPAGTVPASTVLAPAPAPPQGGSSTWASLTAGPKAQQRRLPASSPHGVAAGGAVALVALLVVGAEAGFVVRRVPLAVLRGR